MEQAKTDEGERLIKLALFIKKNAPVTFTAIRRGLHEYGFSESADPQDQRKADQRARRMFERDKASLESCGLRIAVDGDNRYSLDAEASYAAPVDLTPSQVSLLRLVCAARLADEDYPLKSHLRMVLAKIGDDLEVPDMLPGLVDMQPTGELAGLGKVQKAISSRKRLRFSYYNAAGESSQREVEPFGCFFLRGQCYVVAYDPHAAGCRTFRMDRMTRVSVAPGAKPDFEEREFKVEEWRRLPFQFGPTETQVTVKFDPGVAWKAEALAAGTGEFQDPDGGGGDGGGEGDSEGDGGGLLWRVSVGDLKALAAWCAEHGPGIRPVAPQEAVDEFTRGVCAALELAGGSV